MSDCFFDVTGGWCYSDLMDSLWAMGPYPGDAIVNGARGKARHRAAAAGGVRMLAWLLMGLLAFAACHGLLFALLGEEHHHGHGDCPLCLLLESPILLAAVTALIICLEPEPRFLAHLMDKAVQPFVHFQPPSRAPPPA